ncbi:MAG TPA: hypothetical protein VMS74_13495 [Acidimicrobiia bacterium]|nr:hypothetical protein [Acidimicrobiia bacterium]
MTTPPFPEYSSGHSTQSGAWAEVMTAMFGDSGNENGLAAGIDIGKAAAQLPLRS